ncbi:alkaline phosphatase family protein [Pseudomonas batumici]|uniref:Phospholipase C 4 n=1 Tax=Pseudomonas batumici TaxID=226910 RepID=A0A0C2EWK7_9PSED|nr:alkaline phosphatase family protein [Pseudomonas batumici]KIH83118.1 Phospholipase C 4 precursor [Pseudomonas batumici]
MNQIEHVVVVMLENRSLDTMLGWLYPSDSPPSHVLPTTSAPQFDGLRPGMFNPRSDATPARHIAVTPNASGFQIPDPDPQETFANVTYQLFRDGPVSPDNTPPMGFVDNYATTETPNPDQIMQCYSPAQLPVLAQLARAYAVSDAWFASVPSQTWPNRAFVHAGTSNGHVDNGTPPDPFAWNVPTIFNVLESIGCSWSVYSDTILTPSLTRTMFPKLWDPVLNPHFRGFSAFLDACQTHSLPRYSFIEPSFLSDPNDQHPPHDVQAGEAFLYSIWKAVSTSPGWNQTLLVITYDEHGGCFDHVTPPFNAVPPDQARSAEGNGFDFRRFGVRVPTVVISPYIQAGTVFRSDTSSAPYDHTSILATLRDWVGIPAKNMLTSKRIAAAPTLNQLLTLSTARADLPSISAPTATTFAQPSLTAALNDLQKSLVTGSARRFGLDPAATLQTMSTRQHAVDFFTRRITHAHS